MVRVYFLRGQRFHIARTTLGEAYLGQSEVENLGMAISSNENVRWFDVAVDDSFRVCRVQPVGHANGYVQQTFQFHRATSDDVFQSLAFQKFHGNEGLATFLSNVVNRADVGMIQGRRCLCLSLETRKSL